MADQGPDRARGRESAALRPPAGLRRARTGTTPTVEPSSRPWPHPRSQTDRIAPPHALQPRRGASRRRVTPRSGGGPCCADGERSRGPSAVVGGARSAPPAPARPGRSRDRHRSVAVSLRRPRARRTRCSRSAALPAGLDRGREALRALRPRSPRRSATSPSTSCRSSSLWAITCVAGLALFLEVDARGRDQRRRRDPHPRDRARRGARAAEPRALRPGDGSRRPSGS